MEEKEIYTGVLARIIETCPDEEFMVADGFNNAVIGLCSKSRRLIYSVDKAIKILIGEGMSEEDAMEHFYFNVEGSWVGDLTPI